MFKELYQKLEQSYENAGSQFDFRDFLLFDVTFEELLGLSLAISWPLVLNPVESRQLSRFGELYCRVMGFELESVFEYLTSLQEASIIPILTLRAGSGWTVPGTTANEYVLTPAGRKAIARFDESVDELFEQIGQ